MSEVWRKGQVKRVEARFYDVADWETVQCRLCPHLCCIAPSRTGTCGVRSNRDGRLVVDNYGKVAKVELTDASALPLYHYYPASRWLLLGMKGCNFRCTFCNTSAFSQMAGVRAAFRTPDDLVAEALEHGARGIAFGINEPIVSHEFVVDVFRAAREKGLKTFAATNGTWTEEPFNEIVQTTDALTFGFKGFSTEFLMAECGGHLEFVMHNVAAASTRELHVETSYLVIDAHPDWREQAEEFGKWLAEVDPAIPAILLPLEKAFSWKGEPTARESVLEARDILARWLHNVYIQDPDLAFHDTACRQCGKILVRRNETGTILTQSARGACPHCGAALPFVSDSE
ncbi:MAG: pyruvate formate lyase activating enzyme [Candidatus Sumerlaeota bacterium]|nr:pyruvate formate lyase activating enzyme [Candidatus Sumerlaeota bacterium]